MPAEHITAPQVWLCLSFTHLGINGLGFDFKSSRPLAITYQQHIWQSNSSALESSITKGMSVSHALMLNPNLQLTERDIQSEIKKLQELSYWGYRFTSLVSQYNDSSLLLEIGRSSKLFNGLKHLIHLLKMDLIEFRIEAQLGVAHTPKAAFLLSLINHQELSSSRDALAQSKLEHLEQSGSTIRKLRHCGFQFLYEIKAIPQAELGSRFGQDLLVYLRQLWGDLADPQLAITPPETFKGNAEFAEPINNITWIQQQLDRLLEDLVHFISTRQLLCRSFTWHFYHENSRLLKTININVSAQQNLTSAFKELSKLKLDSARFDWEFSSISLSSTHLLPVKLFNDDLFNPTPCREQFQQLLDKLSSRLGDSAIFYVTAKNEHLPELANQCLTVNSQKSRHVREHLGHYKNNTIQNNEAVLCNNKITDALKDEPIWLLEKPKQLIKYDQLPMLEGQLSIIHGPNRVASHWWATLQSRDYYIARQRNGRLLWVFFDRSKKNWFLHGLFA
jgi:protein ImuB